MYFFIYSMSFFQSVMWLFALAFIWTGLKIIFFHLDTEQFLWRIFSVVLLFICLSFTLKATLFSREAAVHPVHLLPFHQFITVLSGGNPETMRSFWMNILLFTPYGMILPELLSDTTTRRTALVTILSSGIFSAVIEICQWYWRLGVAEMDDVMANLLGAGIGFGTFVIGQIWFRKLESQQSEERTFQRRYLELIQSKKSVPTTEIGTRPNDGVSPNGPFHPISGSGRFRIPALYTMDDGTVVAAADARWNTCADGCGLDTIVSVSEDNGTGWRYTFANYLGDNGNRMNPYSTAFIDPLLAVKGDTIYLLVDLWPGSVALNSSRHRPVAGTGFNSDGKLMLKNYASDTYDYILGDFDDDSMAEILGNDGTAVPGYTVDRWFNLYYKGDALSNLFYFTSPYRVCSTSYLYLTTSCDKGKTWSAPLLLNSMVKNAHEPFYGTGPGRGLVTKSGMILFPCYYYIYGVQGTSFIYSADGVNWKRSPTLSDASSESQLVELTDGKIRCFFRNKFGRICYADACMDADGAFTWGEIVKTDIHLHGRSSDCQIAALGCSKKIAGCDILFVACPNNRGKKAEGGGRFNGILRTMQYNPETGESAWIHEKEINGQDDFYGYSCLTELSDGRIAVLYESDSDVNFTWKMFDWNELI